MRILLAEDDDFLAGGITLALRNSRFSVDHVRLGTDADHALKYTDYDLLILDLGLPGMDGMEILVNLRTRGQNLPVLILTARDSLQDRVEGLDSGANDYLTKPFSVEELLARLRVTQRRLSVMMSETLASDAVFTNGSLKIDYAAGCCYLGEEELHLTPIEYKLLVLLAQNVGKVLTHKFITLHIWGSSFDSDVSSLRVFMATLRKKLESAPDSPQYIQTHIGVGYRMMKVE